MKKYLLPVLTLTFLFLPGAVAHAANLPLLDPNFSIVPEACRVDCPCGVGAALQFIQNIMNVLISFAVIVMSLIIAWAGFLFVMSAANPESRSKARGMLINAFVGLFIVLSAWLIVDFIMKRLYGDGSTAFGPWNKILVLSGDQCIVVNNNLGRISGLPGGLAEVGVNGVLLGSGATGPGGTPIPVGAAASGNEAASRAQLSNAGVSVWHNSCPPLSAHCTNTGGMRPSTISQVITVRNKVCGNSSGCRVTLTGGSEPGHAGGTYSHGTGYKADIDDTPAVNAILNTLVHTGQRGGDSGGPIFKDSCGNEYVHESTHWDITVYAPCGL